ncbi:MAG: DUF3120 domain-containing protein [Cyanobacteria bacterium P01_F01_bin.153]
MGAVYPLPLSPSIAGLQVLAAERMISTPALPNQAANNANADNTANNPASHLSSAAPVAESCPLVTESTLLPESLDVSEVSSEAIATEPTRWKGLAIGAFLVSGPVFLEAPLVRAYPVAALTLTLGWLGLAWWCDRQDHRKWWGDILFGFSLSWFAGAVYWGWFRWEPLFHLPLESLGVPVALACLWMGRGRLGSWFYLGSLLGTAVTDAYLWSIDLIPYWEQVMRVEPSKIAPILTEALIQMNTPSGFGWAMVCASALLISGGVALRSRQVAAWIFAGAVLNTLAVDGLFWLTAMFGKM